MEHLLKVDTLLEEPTKVWNLMPESIDATTALDAQYHAGMRDQWVESNQVQTVRNLTPHLQGVQWFCGELPSDGVLLEIGAGVGFDAHLTLQHIKDAPFKAYLLSEIDPTLVEYAKSSHEHLQKDSRVIACCLDGGHLRLADSQVDRILCVAALHHLPDLRQSLLEMDRVAKPGARFVFAMEPNRFWLSLIAKLKPFYKKRIGSAESSAADEQAEGFTWEEMNLMGSRQGWVLQELVPVWFLLGFVHYGLEAIYRLFRLQKRIVLPHKVEKALWILDRFILNLPAMKNMAWHYSAMYQKSRLAEGF